MSDDVTLVDDEFWSMCDKILQKHSLYTRDPSYDADNFEFRWYQLNKKEYLLETETSLDQDECVRNCKTCYSHFIDSLVFKEPSMINEVEQYKTSYNMNSSEFYECTSIKSASILTSLGSKNSTKFSSTATSMTSPLLDSLSNFFLSTSNSPTSTSTDIYNENDDMSVSTSLLNESKEEPISDISNSVLKFNIKVKLKKQKHCKFLLKGFEEPLPSSMICLDSSRPWIVYWISHSLELLGSLDTHVWGPKIVKFINTLWDAEIGGFGGGPLQLPHLAATYASIASLVISKQNHAFSIIDRQKIYNFLLKMRDKGTGGFRVHTDGEVDMRGAYCAVATASILHIITDELVVNLPEYIASCQTYEGGIASEQGLEAHGGYTYCGLATLCILELGMSQADVYGRWLSRAN